MAQKSEHFRCPCCGQHAPIERLTVEGPFQFALFEKTLGGKQPLSEAEKEKQISYGFRRFHVPGTLDYEELPMDEALRELMKKRLEEVSSQ